ncbi:hypothetical protein [Hymenobacter koreensis]|uniref:Uncharacterized protein n=1 Tax=Hymenobacter koreensis TaxID=1084523 RepID=A0ABP8J279_9BACT
MQSWRALHAWLLRAHEAGFTPVSNADFTIYRYCVDKASGHAPDAALAQRFDQQLPEQLSPLPPPELARQLETLCAAAWLHTAWSADGMASAGASARMVQLDQAVQQQARQLGHAPEGESRRNFFRSVRYLRLRLPTSAPLLRQLLEASLPALLPPDLPTTPPQPVELGLDGGLTAELLQLLQLHRSGVPVPGLEHHVRTSLLQLLGVMQRVDFQEGHYSVFPYQLHGLAGAPTFSAELSWHRGDLGQALLFYEAHALLGDNELIKTAELVGLNTLLRTSLAATQVNTPRWDRGASGLAHLYAKIHRLSGHPAYLAGCHYWLNQTQQWLPQELGADRQPTADALSDIIRVGLVLLTALSEDELAWDAILL